MRHTMKYRLPAVATLGAATACFRLRRTLTRLKARMSAASGIVRGILLDPDGKILDRGL